MEIGLKEAIAILRMVEICYSEGLLEEGAIALAREILIKWPKLAEEWLVASISSDKTLIG